MTTFASASDSLLILELTDAQIKNCTIIGDDQLDREGLTGDRHTLII